MSVDVERLNNLVECLDLSEVPESEHNRVKEIARILLVDCCMAVDRVRAINSDNIFKDIYIEEREGRIDTLQLVLFSYKINTYAVVQVLRYQ